jgi:hypothetical protein
MELLAAAHQEWARARTAAARELEEELSANPELPDIEGTDARRRLLMLRDVTGGLGRARQLAWAAAARAHTTPDYCRAVALLVLLECDAGHHQIELRLARRLMVLEPHRQRSRDALRHALVCNHLPDPLLGPSAASDSPG